MIALLYNADCFDVMGEIPDKSIDAVITDPPYGTTSRDWDHSIDLDKFWLQVKRVLRTPHSPAVIFADQPFTSHLIVSNHKWYRHDFIWNKTRHSGAMNVRVRPFKHTEDIVVFSDKKSNYYYEEICVPLDKPITGKYNLRGVRMISGHKENPPGYIMTLTGYPQELLDFRAVRGKTHPTEKPIDLMEYLLRLYTREGDVVLDPFMGSGSTGVACKNLGREFIGVEKDKDYYQLAGERLA